jgi:hypothetical protein
MRDIIFKIGQEYENRKGVYEVLDLNDDTMCIRWESGEEVTTPKDLQSRIIESIYQELTCIKGEKTGKSKQPGILKNAIKFEGLKEGNFSQDITHATWRHYDRLGGAVAVRFQSDKFDMVPWPSFGLSAIYWADPNHKYCDAHRLQAKFFARLDTKCFSFGLMIDLSNPEADVADERNAFIAWLEDPENDSWFSNIVAKHNLSICDVNADGSLGWTLTSDGEKWLLFNGDDQKKEVESLANFLDDMPDNPRLYLQVAKTVKKEDAMARGAEIADDIVGLFEVLMPMYEAVSVTTCP